MSSPVLVNLGCGAVWHDAWRNFDLDPQHPSIERIDLATVLPLADGSVDAVYHAHVLEHLDEPHARRLLGECHRVLKRAGIVRVVVPDLEGLAERYLAALRKGDTLEYDWAVLELLDQLVRAKREGAMGEFLRSRPWREHPQVRERIGTEIVAPPAGAAPSKRHRRIARPLTRLRFAVARLWLTSREREMVSEAQFRATGEVHRWMYDRRSLAQALTATGFTQPVVHTATTSGIAGFPTHQLDATAAGKARHPDSLYMEAIKR